MAAFALLLGLSSLVGPPAPGTVYVIDVVVFVGDPLGSKAEGTIDIVSRPQLAVVSGKPGFVEVGQDWKVTRPDGTERVEQVGTNIELLPIGYAGRKVWVEMTAHVRDVNLGLGIRTAKGVEPGFTDQSVRVAWMVNLGETVRRRIAARSPSDQTWVEVTVRPVR